MSKNLVIVESPAKAKTMEGYLGQDFSVKSSYGHVRDLKKEYDQQTGEVRAKTARALLQSGIPEMRVVNDVWLEHVD